MIDTLYSLVLLLNMTGLFRVLALPIGNSGVISAGLLVVNLGYLVYRYPVAKRILRQGAIFDWGLVLLGWPAAVLLVQYLGGDVGSPAGRAFFVQLYLLSLLVCSAVFVAVKGWVPFRRLAVIAAGVTLVGMILNWLRPAFFYRLGASVSDGVGKVDIATAGSGQLEFRRAAGFFIEPNLTALSCNVLLVALLARYQDTAIRTKLFIAGLMLMLTAASGSRGGMLVNLIVSGMFLWQSRAELRATLRVTKGVAVAGAVALVLVAGAGLLGALSLAGSGLEQQGVEGLASRLMFWKDFGKGGESDLLQDKSLKARLEAQELYIEFIGERPFLGHGPEGTRRLMSVGRTEKMSHNLYFEKAFRYGIPYLMLILIVYFRFYQRGMRWRRALPANASVTTVLVVLLLCAGMVAGGVLESRAVIVVLGAILGYQFLLHRQLTAAAAAARAPQGAGTPVAQVIRA